MTMNYSRTAKDAKGSCRFKVPSRNSPRGNEGVVGKRVRRDYKGADKSLARSGRKQTTATEDFDVHISYL